MMSLMPLAFLRLSSGDTQAVDLDSAVTMVRDLLDSHCHHQDLDHIRMLHFQLVDLPDAAPPLERMRLSRQGGPHQIRTGAAHRYRQCRALPAAATSLDIQFFAARLIRRESDKQQGLDTWSAWSATMEPNVWALEMWLQDLQMLLC